MDFDFGRVEVTLLDEDGRPVKTTTFGELEPDLDGIVKELNAREARGEGVPPGWSPWGPDGCKEAD